MKTKFNLRALLIFNFLLPVLLLLVIQEVACKTTPTSPDSFYRAVVTCTSANTANPQAEQAVYQCLSDVVQGNYMGCLSGLVAAGTWTVDEVACLVRQYATTSAVRINAGTAKPGDQTVLENANAWLKAEKVQYRRAAP